jgi:hypothetical protein
MTARMYPAEPRYESPSERWFIEALRQRLRDLLVICGDMELVRRVGEAVARRLSTSGETA